MEFIIEIIIMVFRFFTARFAFLWLCLLRLRFGFDCSAFADDPFILQELKKAEDKGSQALAIDADQSKQSQR